MVDQVNRGSGLDHQNFTYCRQGLNCLNWGLLRRVSAERVRTLQICNFKCYSNELRVFFLVNVSALRSLKMSGMDPVAA